MQEASFGTFDQLAEGQRYKVFLLYKANCYSVPV